MSKRAQIFVVIGLHGDYDDRDWWTVAAFADEAAATAFVSQLEEEERRVRRLSDRRWERWKADETGQTDYREPKNRLDRDRGPGKVGATYHVQPVPIRTMEGKDARSTAKGR